MPSDPDTWLVPISRSAGPPRLTLVCLAYAGGNPDNFKAWADGMPSGVELVAVRLPGHGRRIGEQRYRDWDRLVSDTFAALSPLLSRDHALFGHSFGGRLAYELTHRATVEYPGRTKRLFVAGCRSPDFPQTRPYMHDLTDDGFRHAVGAMGGTPAEILSDRLLMRVLLPVVRDEIRLAELWGDRHGRPVAVPITAIHGRDDPIDPAASMAGWPAFGGPGSEVVETAGGHFFLDTHVAPLLEIINARLEVSDARAAR
ncbi:MAG TPA: alpha/beta fold hydrolase [Pseudonocardiaceae bacterium]|nr:alpha/beta fold hydrolase [Pseudonocardiaceae bacterium]